MWLINNAMDLVKKGDHIDLPFTLTLQNSALPLVAQHSLRFMPKKRITVLARWGERQVVAKIFFHPKKSHQHFHKELNGLKNYKRSHIPSPLILYSGASEVTNIYVILLEYLKESVSLHTLYKNTPILTEKTALLLPPFHYLAQLHQQGFYHKDLHFGNFLIASGRCLMIDGDGIKKMTNRSPLGLAASLKNVAQLSAQIPLNHRHLLNKLYTAYSKQRGWDLSQPLPKKFLQAVDKATQQRLINYEKKIRRNSSAIQCEKQWRWYIVWQKQYASTAFFHALSTLDTVMDNKKSHYLKKGNTCTVAKVSVEQHHWVIKRFNIKNWRHGLKRAFSRSRGSKCWRNAHLMLLLGITVQKPIAFLERRWGPFRRQAYYISHFVEGTDLLTYTQQHANNEKILHEVCEVVRDLFIQLHTAKITHGDLKATNFIVTKAKAITLIDLDAVTFHKHTASFQASWKKEMKRFMKNWETTPYLKNLFKKIINEDTSAPLSW
ncbi:MAG: lipopolysaccharide kinase InaA family protein [Gammaproteobacteria bacterium]